MGAVSYRARCRLRWHWRASLALAVVVAVMGGIALALVAGAVRTATAPDRYVDARGASFDATVQAPDDGRGPFTAEVAALPAVARIEAATFVFGTLVPEGAQPSDDPDDSAGLVFAGSQAAFGTTLVAGREPNPSDPSEFVTTKSFLDATGAHVGARFDLWVIPSGPARERGYDAADQAYKLLTATLVGVVDGPAQLEDAYAVSAFPASVLAAGDVGISATVGNVTLAPGATVDELRTELDGLPDGSRFQIEPADWVPDVVRDAVSTQAKGLGVLAAIAGVATVVVVGQLLTRQLRLTDEERLVLGAMGANRRQIAADPVLGAAGPTVLGAVVAGALAWLASGIFPTGFARQVEPHVGRRFEAVAVLPGAVALVVLVTAWVAVALVVADRPRARRRSVGVVDGLARRVPAGAGTAMRFAFVRQARDRTGPRTSLVGMVAVVGVLVGALTFGASLDGLLDHPARWGDTYDVGVGQGGAASIPDDVVAAVEADPDVIAVALLANVGANVGTQRFDVAAVQPVTGSSAVHLFAGHLPQGTDEIALGKVDARAFHVDVGDPLVVDGPAGSRTLRVSGIGVMPSVQGGDGMGRGGLMTLDGLRLVDPEVVPVELGIRVRPRTPVAVVQRRLAAATGVAIGPTDRPGAIVNLTRVQAIPYVVAAILGVLALLNLGHQLVLATQRRRRDVAVLRALGADGRWVSGVVHWQASLFAVVVVAIGTPLGIVAGRVVYRAFVDRIGALQTVSVPLAAVVLTIVGMLLLANVVATPNARQARRRPPSGLLAEE